MKSLSREANYLAHRDAPTTRNMGAWSYYRRASYTTEILSCVCHHFVAAAARSSEPHQHCEADGGNQRRRHDRNQQNHFFCSSGELRTRGVSWGEYLRPSRERRPKPSVRIVGIPTHLSVMCWPTSAKDRFGLKIQRLSSRRLVAAAFVWLSAIWAAIANGLVRRSPPSSPKFSVVTPCGTSRSFPNGRRRPF